MMETSIRFTTPSLFKSALGSFGVPQLYNKIEKSRMSTKRSPFKSIYSGTGPPGRNGGGMPGSRGGEGSRPGSGMTTNATVFVGSDKRPDKSWLRAETV